MTIDDVSITPFQPMRLTATIVRRNARDGSLINKEHRTWDSPRDDEPLDPHWLNRYVLGHPPPLADTVEASLLRTSPVTFRKSVAKRVAAELSQTEFLPNNSSFAIQKTEEMN